MPELPEVETILRGIEPFVIEKKLTEAIIRFPTLRWPIPANLSATLKGKKLKALRRRGKYLVFEFTNGDLILHLGMSGRIRVLTKSTSAQKHDHVDLIFDNDVCLRFTDPRRFGALLWADKAEQHPLLADIGPEPLEADFTASYLYEISRQKKVVIKVFIMNGKNVAGVGNIYAAEALFLAGIHPEKITGDLSKEECAALVKAIKTVLKRAIKSGGTTLKDFSNHEGTPGYFATKLQVYGRENQACPTCKTKLRLIRLGQRSTVFCPRCQTL